MIELSATHLNHKLRNVSQGVRSGCSDPPQQMEDPLSDRYLVVMAIIQAPVEAAVRVGEGKC